jgi:hypothetical protein
VIEAESHEELNTLIEHDFQDAIKNDRNGGNGAYARKRTPSKAMAVAPNSLFDWIITQAQGIMDQTAISKNIMCSMSPSKNCLSATYTSNLSPVCRDTGAFVTKCASLNLISY